MSYSPHGFFCALKMQMDQQMICCKHGKKEVFRQYEFFHELSSSILWKTFYCNHYKTNIWRPHWCHFHPWLRGFPMGFHGYQMVFHGFQKIPSLIYRPDLHHPLVFSHLFVQYCRVPVKFNISFMLLN